MVFGEFWKESYVCVTVSAGAQIGGSRSQLTAMWVRGGCAESATEDKVDRSTIMVCIRSVYVCMR